jgi:WD40 repeat protein
MTSLDGISQDKVIQTNISTQPVAISRLALAELLFARSWGDEDWNQWRWRQRNGLANSSPPLMIIIIAKINHDGLLATENSSFAFETAWCATGTDIVWSIAFEVDGQSTALASHDRIPRTWNTATGQVLELASLPRSFFAVLAARRHGSNKRLVLCQQKAKTVGKNTAVFRTEE